MQDMILMGFLMEGDLTGYEIKKKMQESTTFFFNTSFGSIYPALTKLEKNEMVSVKSTVENGRAKKLHSISEKGRETFLNWLKQEAGISKIKDEALLKIFFFNHLDLTDREPLLNKYIENLKNYIQELEKLRDFFITTRPERDFFKMTPLNFGIDYYNFIQKWFSDYMEREHCRDN